MLGSFLIAAEGLEVVQTTQVHCSAGHGTALDYYGKGTHDSWITMARAVAGIGKAWGSIARHLMAEPAA